MIMIYIYSLSYSINFMQDFYLHFLILSATLTFTVPSPYNLHADSLSILNTMWAHISLVTIHKATMFHTTDLYLGTFLILSGFSLSLLNLKRVITARTMFSTFLLSENIILMCIGITFIVRAVHNLQPVNLSMTEMEERTAEMISMGHEVPCGYWTVFMSFGPLVVPLVNSFLSLVIDNYMHYKMLLDMKKKDEENTVHEITIDSRQLSDVRVKVFRFWKKYFSSLVIVLQWAIPVLFTLFMYPMGVKQMVMTRSMESLGDSCMTMMEVTNSTCLEAPNNLTSELRKYTISKDFIKVYDNIESKNNLTVINSVLENVYKIVHNLSNFNVNVTSSPLYRKPKLSENCMTICYMESKDMLLFMFILAIVSFCIPVTFSTFILTKIHVMDVKKPNHKTYASRELLYNILFWSPVMFDNYLTLLFCAHSTNGVRTSLFNVVANVYQAVKNFVNTKYFNENAVVPA